MLSMLLICTGALALPPTTRPNWPPTTRPNWPSCSRRDALGLTFALNSPAYAYDAIPTTATGADPGVERRRKEREQRVATLNAQVTPLLATVRNSKTAAEYDDAVTKLTVWIIGTGPPAPVNTEGGLGVFAGSLPDGFRTRALVATCKETLDSLPRYYQKAGEYVYGLPECVPSRDSDFCASAGPAAESAYKLMLRELKSRAARQYETPYGPVAF